MKKLNKFKVITVLAAVPLLSTFFYPAASYAAPVIAQGTTPSFAVLAYSGITVTTSASITGTVGSDIGSSTASITGPTPSPVGTIHAIGDAATLRAQTDLVTAFNNTNAPSATVIPADLNAQVLTPGSYKTGSSFANSGSLTFDAQGDPNAIFVMQSPSSTITTSTGSTMVLRNGAQACNIFWAIGSSATLGVSSTFLGHLYAHTSITVDTSATVHGNLLANTGAVTLDTNTIVNDNCASVVVSGPPQQSTITSVSPTNCVISGTTAITLNGTFPTPVTNITVNGTAAATGSWTQTATTVTVKAVTSSTIPTVIQIYNGQIPVLAAQSFTCTPVAVVVPVPTPTPTPTVTPVAPGTIHVVKTVVNGFGGTATSADFTLSLRHHGIDVVGSPDVGMSAPGRTYVLAPGTYVVGEAVNPAFPNYISSFSIVGQSTNLIDLKSGDDLTVIETNTQLAPLVVATAPPVVTPPVVVKPVTGGKLPKTGSPWYNMLLLSAGLVLLGGVGARLGKTARNK